jgi:hypothetical protein
VPRLFQLLSKAEDIDIGLVSGDTRSDNASLSFSSCSMKSVSVIYLFYNADALVSQHTPSREIGEREMINTESKHKRVFIIKQSRTLPMNIY